MMPRPIDTLEPGQRFVIPGTGRKGELLSVHPGCVRVSYDTHKEERFVTEEGKEVSFTKKKEMLTISRGTEVQRLVKKRRER